MHERKPTVSQLTHDRIDLLNQLGFLWSRKNQNRPKILKWDERLTQLLLFKEEFGHTMVPRRYEDDLPQRHEDSQSNKEDDFISTTSLKL